MEKKKPFKPIDIRTELKEFEVPKIEPKKIDISVKPEGISPWRAREILETLHRFGDVTIGTVPGLPDEEEIEELKKYIPEIHVYDGIDGVIEAIVEEYGTEVYTYCVSSINVDSEECVFVYRVPFADGIYYVLMFTSTNPAAQVITFKVEKDPAWVRKDVVDFLEGICEDLEQYRTTLEEAGKESEAKEVADIIRTIKEEIEYLRNTYPARVFG